MDFVFSACMKLIFFFYGKLSSRNFVFVLFLPASFSQSLNFSAVFLSVYQLRFWLSFFMNIVESSVFIVLSIDLSKCMLFVGWLCGPASVI